MSLYKGDDFFYDHPVLSICFSIILVLMVSIGLVLIIHKTSLDTIKYQKEMEVFETEEKARICKETGYCNSKNIDIKYNKEEE